MAYGGIACTPPVLPIVREEERESIRTAFATQVKLYGQLGKTSQIHPENRSHARKDENIASGKIVSVQRAENGKVRAFLGIFCHN
mmetsp:Transcript_21693/g.52983  ORF Transcript_21693/g.52983 Transcript_21693/m.52983 type:complete len:85 (-) Transcript_21693:185-439(-)